MFVTFQLKSAPHVLMREEHAQRILSLLGKDVHQGIITSDETSQAINKLITEMGASHPDPSQLSHDLGHSSYDEEHNSPIHHPPIDTVSFYARAYPFLQLLKTAQEDKTDIVWGV